MTSDYEVAGTLNRYVDNDVRKLNINEPTEYMIHVGNLNDPIQEAFSKYANHPSIVNINKIVEHSSFLIEDIQMDEIESELKDSMHRKEKLLRILQ